MKKILPWLKTNWLLMVMSFLVVASLVCGWIFSHSWRNTMLTDHEKLAADRTNALAKAKVS